MCELLVGPPEVPLLGVIDNVGLLDAVDRNARAGALVPRRAGAGAVRGGGEH